jgi:hypothetical protein
MTMLFANVDDIFDRSLAWRTGKNTRQNNELASDLDVSGSGQAPRKPLAGRKST